MRWCVELCVRTGPHAGSSAYSQGMASERLTVFTESPPRVWEPGRATTHPGASGCVSGRENADGLFVAPRVSHPCSSALAGAVPRVLRRCSARSQRAAAQTEIPSKALRTLTTCRKRELRGHGMQPRISGFFSVRRRASVIVTRCRKSETPARRGAAENCF